MLYPLLTLFWILVGLALFLHWDRQEMKKHVPYGDLPVLLSLPNIRRGLAVVCMIGALPILTYVLVQSVVEDVVKWFRLRRAVRHADKLIAKSGPEVQAMWKKMRP